MSITKITIENTSESALQNVPFTFGQVFAEGDLTADKGLEGLQLDAKAFHPDGSVRHALISGYADLPAKGSKVVELVAAEKIAVRPVADKVAPLTNAVVQITIDGEVYTATNSTTDNRWLDGPLVQEVHSNMPLTKADGVAHPHLHARFADRSYLLTPYARIDITVENAWAYEANPQNFTYDVVVTVDGKEVYSKKALTHLHHARWRQVFWTSNEPQIHIKHDAAYLIASRAVPNYDQSVVVPEKSYVEWRNKWEKAGKGPMQIGLPGKGMADTGGRPDIAILPAWAVFWLLTNDVEFKGMTLGTADCAGSWSMHYRDKNTGYPISLIDYPYMTIKGNPGDTTNPQRINPVTKKGTQEAFPALNKATSVTPYSHDVSHHPSFHYLPYLLTGDYYYLEGLQFWAMYNAFQSNPGYRKNTGIWAGQVRGIAWTLRTLGEAVYITPDNHALKGHLSTILYDNLALGNKFYAHDPLANPLGVYTGKGAVVYLNNDAIAPFQDDYLTAALGSLVEKGFEEARPMFEWKARFPVERMVGDGANWLAAATYAFPIIGEGHKEFTNIKDCYDAIEKYLAAGNATDKANLARIKGNGIDMAGYATSTEGFVSNLQPALAYAAPLSEKGRRAYELLQSRSPKPDYGTGAQFAIVPRNLAAISPPKDTPVPPVIITPPVVKPIPTPPVAPIPPVVLVPRLDDAILITRDNKSYPTTVASILELIQDTLVQKYPILSSGSGQVEIKGSFTIQAPTK